MCPWLQTIYFFSTISGLANVATSSSNKHGALCASNYRSFEREVEILITSPSVPELWLFIEKQNSVFVLTFEQSDGLFVLGVFFFSHKFWRLNYDGIFISSEIYRYPVLKFRNIFYLRPFLAKLRGFENYLLIAIINARHILCYKLVSFDLFVAQK